MVRLALLLAAATASAQPSFVGTVSRVSALELPYSYRAGCPVGPAALRRLRLSYFGFDDRAHVGQLVVNARVAREVVGVFRELYAQRFPIRRMEPIDAYRARDAVSLAADNTSAFNCRYAVAGGPRRWSVHAFGEAIDVNPLENPYVDRGVVRPSRGRAFLDRSNVRKGMAVRGGALVGAFARAGWAWGGRWAASPDYQHFSATGG